jgi:hypothetical protein
LNFFKGITMKNTSRFLSAFIAFASVNAMAQLDLRGTASTFLNRVANESVATSKQSDDRKQNVQHAANSSSASTKAPSSFSTESDGKGGIITRDETGQIVRRVNAQGVVVSETKTDKRVVQGESASSNSGSRPSKGGKTMLTPEQRAALSKKRGVPCDSYGNCMD